MAVVDPTPCNYLETRVCGNLESIARAQFEAVGAHTCEFRDLHAILEGSDGVRKRCRAAPLSGRKRRWPAGAID